MAHKTENEETEFKVVPETTTITLCVKCGVATAATNNNLCQKCTPLLAEKPFRSVQQQPIRPISERSPVQASRDLVKEADPVGPVKREVNRCSGCRKRVGLTGFRCRCGELFCAEHRYSDRHDCSYDYKGVGRETIARENPVVKAAKIVRI